MILYNKRVKYTPEIITILKGTPVIGTVIAEGDASLEILLDDGSKMRVDKYKCEIE